MANRPARPQGFSWVCPALTVRDPDAALAFYVKAFGFTRQNAIPGPDGKTMHAELRYKEITIMLGPEGGMGSTCKTPAHSGLKAPMSLYLYHEDVDAFTQRAKAAGAVVVSEPAEMFWGDRMASLKDPDGYVWMVATNVADFDPSKVPAGK